MKYTVESLKEFGFQIACAFGMSEADAKNMADNLIASDMRGIRSHGLTKLSGYAVRIERGITSPTAQPEITMDNRAVFAVDGKNGMGSTIGAFAMRECIRRATEYGVSFATVNHASHYGFGGYYVMQAAQAGMIGFSICNAPALVAPFGGRDPMLGTNPLSIAIPSGSHPDLVLDMATSTVAKGKIALAMKEGRPIPLGWALDAEGNPTTDPVKANVGALTPLGGAKGYALALIIDVICSCMAGAQSSMQIQRMFENPTEPSDVGYFMGAIDIGKFVDLKLFEERADVLYNVLKAGAPAPGFEQIMIPGEIEYNLTQRTRADGIEISEPVLKELRSLAQRYHVSADLLQEC